MEGPSIRNDVPESFLEMFTNGGPFSYLTELAAATGNTVDLHFRNRRGEAPRATLYLGTSRIVHIHYGEKRKGRLKIERQNSTRIFGDAISSWRAKHADVDDEWGRQQPVDDAIRSWADAGPDLIEGLMAADQGDAAKKHTGFEHEGYLQAGIAKSGFIDRWTIINRESIVSFENEGKKEEALGQVREPVDRVLEELWSGNEPWTFGKKKSDGGKAEGARSKPSGFGNKLDALGVDNDGNLLAIEVKGGYDTAGIAWTPAQVLVYKRLLDLWHDGPEDSLGTLNRSLDQRRRLGMAGAQELADDFRIIPVIVVGPIDKPGSAATATERMGKVTAALKRACRGELDDLRVYQLEGVDLSCRNVDIENGDELQAS